MTASAAFFLVGILVGFTFGSDFYAQIPNRTEVIQIISGTATTCLVLFTALLWLSTDKLWKASDKSLRTTERAFVFPDGFTKQITVASDAAPLSEVALPQGSDPSLLVTRFAVHPRWKNSGSTPTVNMKIEIDWCGPGGSNEVGTYRSAPQNFFIGPKSSAKSDAVEMPSLSAVISSQNNPITAPGPELLIWGKATYQDIFGEEHWVEWCFKATPERHRKDRRLKVHFIQYGSYNRSDRDTQDSETPEAPSSPSCWFFRHFS